MGLRVLVTRPQPQADALAGRLRTMGVEAVVAPVLSIVPRPVARPLPSAHALLITSAQALAFLDREPDAGVTQIPLFAVGAASARAARARGWIDVRTAAGDGAALCDLVRLLQPKPARLLYLAGRVRRPEVERMLTADGYTVELIETYDTVATGWTADAEVAIRTAQPDAVLHFSPASAAAAWEAAGTARLQAWFLACRHLCLSDDVAAPLRRVGCAHIDVASSPDTEALLRHLRLNPTA